LTVDRFRVLGWLIPVLCSGASGWFVYQRNLELGTVSATRNQARIDVQKATEQKKQIEGLPVERRYATVNDSPSEEYTFITYLKTSAVMCGVTLTNLTSQSADPKNDPAAKENAADPLMKGIDRRDTIITMNGSYGNLRNMISTLETSDRLFALSNLTWTRTESATSVTVDVTRYVIPVK